MWFSLFELKPLFPLLQSFYCLAVKYIRVGSYVFTQTTIWRLSVQVLLWVKSKKKQSLITDIVCLQMKLQMKLDQFFCSALLLYILCWNVKSTPPNADSWTNKPDQKKITDHVGRSVVQSQSNGTTTRVKLLTAVTIVVSQSYR